MVSCRPPMIGLLLCGLVCASNARADWKDDIGYTRLLAELGTLEDGTGILISQTEADINNDPNIYTYMPNVNDGQFAGKNIVDGSGLSSGTFSGHSNNMARTLFGNTISIANGATDLTVYEANDFVTRVLGFDPSSGTNTDPLTQAFQVQNHSWIGNVNPDSIAVDWLERLDYLIDRDQVSVAVGLNNGNGPQPDLLGQGYNVISVGVSDGDHSRGLTTLYGSGRIMPNVVIPSTTTSTGTARTSSVLTVLHHKALNLGNPDASRPETMKAVLMAGATKDEFPGWARSTTQPVDTVYGAGEVNIYNSYHILQGGETDGSTSVPGSGTIDPYGWDYGESIDAGSPLYYNIEINIGQRIAELSVMLNWNMDVTDTDNSGSFSALTSLADMSLRLYDSSLAPLGFLLDESLSPVDNFEHIFFHDLAAGLYTIEVSTDRTTDFALAWRATVVPEPNFFVLSGLACLGLIVLVYYRRQKPAAGAGTWLN